MCAYPSIFDQTAQHNTPKEPQMIFRTRKRYAQYSKTFVKPDRQRVEMVYKPSITVNSVCAHMPIHYSGLTISSSCQISVPWRSMRYDPSSFVPWASSANSPLELPLSRANLRYNSLQQTHGDRGTAADSIAFAPTHISSARISVLVIRARMGGFVPHISANDIVLA